MRRTVNSVTLLAAAAVLTAGIITRTTAQTQPSTQPTRADATNSSAAAAPDRMQQIMAEVQTTGQEMSKLIASPKVFSDPAMRAEVAPKLIPNLKKLEALASELLSMNNEQARQLGGEMGADVRFMLVVFGDADAKTKLERDAGAPDLNAAQRAQAQLVTSRWLVAAGNADAQAKALDDLDALAKANATSDTVTIELMKLAQLARDSETASKRIDTMISGMRSAAAGEWTQMAAQRKEMEQAEAKLHALENKPLAITGTTVDGKPFNTADWKGKVILVDFWATWCGPCIAELPRVKKVYKDYHDKGFEIVGVSCDVDAQKLKTYVAQDDVMKWPQLFDAAENPKLQWHPLAKSLGINAIPTMFLIDKEGVLRTADARENFEEMIPKLLAETPK